MSDEGIIWGPSMRGYMAENKARISRVGKSLASLKNQTGQYAQDHRRLLTVYREVNDLLAKHLATSLPRPERQSLGEVG